MFKRKYIIILLIFITALTAKSEITLSFVGDMMTGSDFPDKSYLPPNEGRDIFSDVSDIIQKATIAFANLEGCIADTNTSSRKRGAKSYSFRMPPYMANRIAEAGFDILAVANNHSRDFGETGFNQTKTYVENAGMKIVGNIKDAATFITVDKKKIGYLAFYYFGYNHNAIQDIEAAKTLIAKTKKECDFLVVSFHGGAEGEDLYKVPKTTEMFYGENRGDVYKFARAASDAGANIVVGHGPHVLRAIEIYNETLIAYSLGNFIGYKQFTTLGNKGLGAILTVTLNEKLKIKSAEIVSIRLKNDGTPVRDEIKEAVTKINTYSKNDFPETHITLNENGAVNF